MAVTAAAPAKQKSAPPAASGMGRYELGRVGVCVLLRRRAAGSQLERHDHLGERCDESLVWLRAGQADGPVPEQDLHKGRQVLVELAA